jgi:ATP-dependent Clp protease ATP-binding subunit ClpA
MQHQGKTFDITDDAINKLVDKGFSPAYGARFLKRTIDEIVKLPMTNKWKDGVDFDVDVEDGDVKINVS